MTRTVLNVLAVASFFGALTCAYAWTQRGPQPAPYGTLALALLIFPAVRAALALRADAEVLHRIDHGLCRGCGYSLRGSDQRCPECGRPFRPHERAALRPEGGAPAGRKTVQ